MTAGHDGFGTASWPAFIDMALSKVWSKMGVELEVVIFNSYFVGSLYRVLVV